MGERRFWLKLAKGLVPPLAMRLLKDRGGLGFHGDYAAWSEAEADCSGYDQPAILERVTAATQAVVDGKAAFERDSVLFDSPEYNWPLLAVLQDAARRQGNSLRLIDFGGSLGSTYRQCRPFLSGLGELRWNVIEQGAFVRRGQDRFQTGELRFFPDIDACLADGPAECLLLSSVLQYLEDPYAFLSGAMAKGFASIILDRTPFSAEGRERIVKQTVPAAIYSASYPARLLDERKMRALFAESYDIVAEYPSLDGFDEKAVFKGWYARRKETGAPAPRVGEQTSLS
jgi:putative methyltransferase (TIGR04325 family)